MKLARSELITEIDAYAQNTLGVSVMTLMERSGEAVASVVRHRVKEGGRVVILAGKGNNGGDGFCVADRLSKIGAFVTVITPLGAPKTVTANKFFKFLPSVTVTDKLEGEFDIIIDALFGIGLDRTVAGKAAEVIDFMNFSKGVKIALDLPSGIMSGGKIVSALPVALIPPSPCKNPPLSYTGFSPIYFSYIASRYS